MYYLCKAYKLFHLGQTWFRQLKYLPNRLKYTEHNIVDRDYLIQYS